jgi:hypothetical protein
MLAPPLAIITHVISPDMESTYLQPGLFHQPHVSDELLGALSRLALLAVQLEEEVGGIF